MQGCVGLIPNRGAKIPPALWPKNQNIKQKQYCNKFRKDFKNGPHQKKKKKKSGEKLAGTQAVTTGHSQLAATRRMTEKGCTSSGFS